MLERQEIGDWTLSAAAAESGEPLICMLSSFNDQDLMLSITAERAAHVWTLGVNGKSLGWQLEPGKRYQVSYVIDDRSPVEVEAIALSESTVGFVLGRNFAQTQPLARGKRFTLRASRGAFSFSLAGSSRALDAALDCANRYLGFDEARASSNPFAEAAPVQQQANRPPGNIFDQIDRAVEEVKQVRLARVIFATQPVEETVYRGTILDAALSVPEDQRPEKILAATQAYLAKRVQEAIIIAPSDVLAKLVRHNYGAMQRLQSQPETCAAYFVGVQDGTWQSVPSALRAELGEIYADVVEAAARKEKDIHGIPEQEVGAWMQQAYAANGYDIEDLLELGNASHLSAGEICRIGTEYMAVLASFSDDRLGTLYRSIWLAAVY